MQVLHGVALEIPGAEGHGGRGHSSCGRNWPARVLESAWTAIAAGGLGKKGHQLLNTVILAGSHKPRRIASRGTDAGADRSLSTCDWLPPNLNAHPPSWGFVVGIETSLSKARPNGNPQRLDV